MRRKLMFFALAAVVAVAVWLWPRTPNLPPNLEFLEGSRSVFHSPYKQFHEVEIAPGRTLDAARKELELAGGKRASANGVESWSFRDRDVFLLAGRQVMQTMPGGRRASMIDRDRYFTVIVIAPPDRSLWDRLLEPFRTSSPSKKQ